MSTKNWLVTDAASATARVYLAALLEKLRRDAESAR